METKEISIGAGLTKREYFAALAMQGFCASGIGTDHSIKQQLLRNGLDADDENVRADAIAIYAVACADQPIKRLNSQSKQTSI